MSIKYRTGFVSNSSSSSFVVGSTAYDTVFDLAKIMIKTREWGKSDRALLGLLDEAIAEGKDPNINLSFSSCNYDTYIIKSDDYLVQTCNNHRFEDDIEGIVSYKDIYEHPFIKKYITDSDPYLSFGSTFDFWYPEYALIGRELPYEETSIEDHKCKHYGASPIVVKKLDKRLSFLSKKDQFLIDLGVALCPMCFLNKRKRIKYRRRENVS